MPPSVPRTNRSIRPVPREVTDGADAAMPPALVQPLHPVVHVFRQTAASPPRTNTSILPVELETEAGADVAPPGGAPIDTQPGDQEDPLRYRCWTVLPAPRMNTSTTWVPRRGEAAGAA